MPSLVPITTNSRTVVPLKPQGRDTSSNAFGQYSQILASSPGFPVYGNLNLINNNYTTSSTMIGSNHGGVSEPQRIVMAHKSGIDSEVDWALTTLARNSINPYLNFEKDTYIAHELLKHLYKPYQLILEKNDKLVTQRLMTHSLDALLILRNSAQDLANQQWLSQVGNLKKQLVDILKILSDWFFKPGAQFNELAPFENQFAEALNYIVDLLEPLTCYYINNTRNDPLFHSLLRVLMETKDKNLFINVLKCLSHLLITRDKNAKLTDDDSNEEDHDDFGYDDYRGGAGQDDEETRITNNCVNSLTSQHLEHIVEKLLVADNELSHVILQFLKMYLYSEAIYEEDGAQYGPYEHQQQQQQQQQQYSVIDSQRYRLKKLLQLSSTKTNYEILVKQLPLLIVSNLPLIEPAEPKQVPLFNLTKRTHYSGAPITAPELTSDLYRILVHFAEPIRATTWLHCCYEPTTSDQVEVTQISIWKAYETQFQEVWKTDLSRRNPHLHPLLPAVEFIKNVTKAFPYAEAKVINLPQQGNETPKKKFIIKGIRPRQFPTSIELGNYEAMRPLPEIALQESNSTLPAGHIDTVKFQNYLANETNFILADPERSQVIKSYLSAINEESHELLDYIIRDIFIDGQYDKDGVLANIFKLHNSHWLPDLVYANPSLLETGIFKSSWLNYLL